MSVEDEWDERMPEGLVDFNYDDALDDDLAEEENHSVQHDNDPDDDENDRRKAADLALRQRGEKMAKVERRTTGPCGNKSGDGAKMTEDDKRQIELVAVESFYRHVWPSDKFRFFYTGEASWWF